MNGDEVQRTTETTVHTEEGPHDPSFKTTPYSEPVRSNNTVKTSDPRKEKVRILAMSHSTSEWNLRLNNHKKDNGVAKENIIWKQSHDFKTTYDKPEQIDAALSEDGVAACEAQREDFQKKYPNIKYILCSPTRRTVQTLNHMMKNYTNMPDKHNIVMFPEITDEVENLSDLAFETRDLMKKHKKEYNWDFMDPANYDHPEIWFLYNINESMGITKLKWEQIGNWRRYGDKEKLMKYWKDSERKLSDARVARAKTEESKTKVIEYIKKNEVEDDELLLISHNNFLNYFTNDSFKENNEPTIQRNLKNLEVLKHEI